MWKILQRKWTGVSQSLDGKTAKYEAEMFVGSSKPAVNTLQRINTQTSQASGSIMESQPPSSVSTPSDCSSRYQLRSSLVVLSNIIVVYYHMCVLDVRQNGLKTQTTLKFFHSNVSDESNSDDARKRKRPKRSSIID